MNDDWRLQVNIEQEGHAEALLGHLDAGELEHDLSDAFHDRIVVSREGPNVFLYAGTREQAEQAREHVLEFAQQHGWTLEMELLHWHPTAEEWEDPDKPLPADDAARLVEHEALIATERREVEKSGRPEYEVRVDLPSRHEAVEFARRLKAEGLPVVHRWRFLLIGVTDEDSAKVLAERLRNEAPLNSTVKVEGTWRAAYAERRPNPYAVLGGLGG